MELKDLINKLPSNVSGDGKNFVMMLKKILSYIKDSTQEQIDQSMENVSKPAVEFVNNIQLVEETPNLKVVFGTVGVKNYAGAIIEYRKDDGEWQRAGETTSNTYVLPNVVVGSTYYVRVVVKGYEDAVDEAPVTYTKIKGNTLICDTPKQFYLKWDGVEALWEWGNYTDNGYTDFYELRLDQNAGVWNENLLEQTRNNYSTVPPRVNNGTAYLFVRNKFGQYNAPAVHIFNLEINYKPNPPAMYNMIRGVEIIMSPLPEGCDSYRLNLDGETYESVSNRFFYYKTTGTVRVSYCYVAGESAYEYSDPIEVKINALTVKTEDIADGAVTHEKLAANSVYADNLSANSVMAKHLYGETINLSNELAIAGGAVKLDEAGLHCNMSNGSTINFNTSGMSVQDSNGREFSQIARLAYGVASHNEYVDLNWDIAPRTVLMIPYSTQSTVSGYTSSDLYIKCFADNVTSQGFRANCYTTIASGSYAKQYLDEKLKDKILVNKSMSWREENWYTDFAEIIVPAGASTVNISASASFLANYFEAGWGESGAGGFMWEMSRCWGLWVQVFVDDQWVMDIKISDGVAKDYGEGAYTHYRGVSGTSEATITVQSPAKISLRAWGKTYSRDSLGYLNLKLERSSITSNVTGDTVISSGSATYFAIG